MKGFEKAIKLFEDQNTSERNESRWSRFTRTVFGRTE